MDLKTHFDFLKQPSPYTIDILEHLDVLKQHASKCDHITEFGFRTGTSFTAFLMGEPKKLITYDITYPPEAKDFFDSIKGPTEIEMVQMSTVCPGLEIEETDLLFIDTLHTYDQLNLELRRHGNKAKKYIILHDTETFGHIGEDGKRPGLMGAVDEFIFDNPHWQIEEIFTHNNGLTILVRDEK